MTDPEPTAENSPGRTHARGLAGNVLVVSDDDEFWLERCACAETPSCPLAEACSA